ncbi:MAG: hypothetical protein CME07_06575 [Gemmatimonadetes bacterium]|jgi:MATE family multidrug resistance protein|nr:hypothetical protein [Gemmatimonadota bacterium]
MISITLLGTADTILMGRVGTEAQAGVGIAMTFLFTVMCFFLGILDMVQTFVARATGRGDAGKAAAYGSAGFHLALLFSIPTALTAFGSDYFFELLGTTPEIIPAASAYFRIRMIGCVFFYLSRTSDAWFRGIGDTRTPMFVTVAENALNVGISLVLILGWERAGIPAMGARGAALGTVIATAAHTLANALIAARMRARGRPSPAYFVRSRLDYLRKTVRVGFPSGIHWLLDVGAWTVFTFTVASMGPTPVAANLIALTVVRAAFMPGYGIGTAGQTLVGKYLGAGDDDSAERAGWATVRVGAVYMAFMGVIFLTFRTPLVALFNGDPEVISLGARLLLWGAVFQLGDGVCVTLNGALRGAGDTRFVMKAGILTSWLFFLPVTLVLIHVFGLGVEGGWIGICAWVFSQAILFARRFQGGAWKRVLRVEEPRPVPEAEVV